MNIGVECAKSIYQCYASKNTWLQHNKLAIWCDKNFPHTTPTTKYWTRSVCRQTETGETVVWPHNKNTICNMHISLNFGFAINCQMELYIPLDNSWHFHFMSVCLWSWVKSVCLERERKKEMRNKRKGSEAKKSNFSCQLNRRNVRDIHRMWPACAVQLLHFQCHQLNRWMSWKSLHTKFGRTKYNMICKGFCGR